MKKGFTLIELLAVVVLIGVLSLLIIPALVKNYDKSLEEIMTIQERQISDAAALAAEDFCNRPTGVQSKKKCKYSFSNIEGLFQPINSDESKILVCVSDLKQYCTLRSSTNGQNRLSADECKEMGEDEEDYKYCLSTGKSTAECQKENKYFKNIVNLDYYNSEAEFEKHICRGFTILERNSRNKYENPKTYLYCGEYLDELDYSTEGDLSRQEYMKYLKMCGYYE